MEEPIKITVQSSEDEKIELTFSWENDIEDWKYTFKTILTWMGFANETIDNLFYEEK